MPATVLLMLSLEGGHNVFLVPRASGVYVSCVLRQWLDGREGFTSRRLMELLEFDVKQVQRFAGVWPSFSDLRRAALLQGYDVVETFRNTVYVYKHKSG